MSVMKYKPKSTPRELDRKLEDTAATAAGVVETAKTAIARSKKVVQNTREALDACHSRSKRITK